MQLNRQFWLGVLAGLSAGSALRREAAGGLAQVDIRRVYNLWAPIYALADVYLLGQLPRLRQIAVDRLRLTPGDSVLEISCGTGTNFPYLLERIGPSGRLVGIDYTPALLADARLSERWCARPFNWFADLLGVGAAADIGRRPWELLSRYLTNAGHEELLLGFLYVAWGQQPPYVDKE